MTAERQSETASWQAQTLLAALEQAEAAHGRDLDMADIFVAQWRSYLASQTGTDKAVSPLHNALLLLWLAEDQMEGGLPRIVPCTLTDGDAYPFTLPRTVERRPPEQLIPWEQWSAAQQPALQGMVPRPRQYLALYVRGETLCWQASPGLPLLDQQPDVRAIVTPLPPWHDLPDAGGDHPSGVGAVVSRPGSRTRYLSPIAGKDSLTIGSSTLLPYTFRAIRAPELWTRPGGGRAPYYEEDSSDVEEHERIRVILHPSDGRSPLTPEQEAASYAAVSSLDDDKIRAFAICLGAWFAGTQGGDPALGKVTLTANAILEYQGIKRWKGSYTTTQKNKVADDVWALNQIFIRGPQAVFDSRGRERIVNVRSRLLEVAQEDDITLFREEVPRAFRVAPGDWIKPLIGDGTRYVAALLAPVLRYNPQQGVGRIAMRLGLHLALHWRFRAAHGNYEQPWYIRTLLESTGIPIPTHREQRRRLVEHFEQALDQLLADGVIGAWQYAKHAEEEKPHSVFPEWIQRTVSIAPPQPVIDQYAELAPRRRREIAAAKRRGK